MPNGGLVLLFSDGLNETADERGNEFGLQRVKNELVAHRKENAQTICDKLWLAMQNHSSELSRLDDFTALIIKRDWPDSQ